MSTTVSSDMTMTASSVFEEDSEVLCLRVASSPDDRLDTSTQILVDTPLVVGREVADSDAPLSKGKLGVIDGRISRKHARISSASEGTVLIEDLGSKNGTWVNGRRVSSVAMERDSVLRIGDTILVYCPMAPPGTDNEKEMGLVGRSRTMAEVRRAIRQVAGEALSVLVTGETGTGKELVAAAVHARSNRAGAFVAVNSTAIPATLFESELFGVKRGAFSGAKEDRKGLIREADTGTLFLDEIGDMPAEVQGKLLRTIEQQEVTPVGSSRSVKVDVRFLAATNAQIREKARDGGFRADLLHRLCQFPIVVPPLRARREDIIRLWEHFANEFGYAERAREDANVLEALAIYDWPGNVRELRNAASQYSVRSKESDGAPMRSLAREIVLAYKQSREGPAPHGKQSVALPHATPKDAAADESTPYRYVSPRAARPDKETLLQALSRHGNSIAAVAREFGCHRQQIYRWMDYHEIER